MKLSQATRINLAARKEQIEMEAAGYYKFGIILGNENIEDVKVSKDLKSIWIKLAE